MNMGAITIRAKRESLLRMWSDRYHTLIKDSFKEFGISFRCLPRTSSKTHHELASKFFKTLYDKGEFIERHLNNIMMKRLTSFWPTDISQVNVPIVTQKAYTVTNAKVWYFIITTDLINPKSAISGSKPVMREKPNIGICRWTSTKAGCANGFWKTTKNGVPTCTDSARAGWIWALQFSCRKPWPGLGVSPFPWKERKEKCLYVWFDAPIGYIQIPKNYCPTVGKHGGKTPKHVWFILIGKDNIVFHCIVFRLCWKRKAVTFCPIMCQATNSLNLEEIDFHIPQLGCMAARIFTGLPRKQDVLRYVLTANAPETKDMTSHGKTFRHATTMSW